MTKPLLLAAPGDEAAAAAIAQAADAELGALTTREFPDGELYVRIATPCPGRDVWIVSSLFPPRDKLLAAYLIGATARDLGASRVGLCAPYLAYLRQDDRFHDGEGVTAHYVARLIALGFDRLITIDPHLHRFETLDRVYPIPGRVVPAAPAIARWIAGAAERPVVVGPDAESRQWVAAVAESLGCDPVILAKTRRGDREVAVSAAPTDVDWRGRTPVIVDDIISSGQTMIATVATLRDAGAAPPFCVGIHAVLAGDAVADLLAAGARAVVTCNTIRHATNGIDVLGGLGRGLAAPW